MPHSSAPGTRRAISTAVSASADERQQHRPAVQIAERHQRARRGDDETGPLEADRRDQQADAGGDRMLERLRESP